MSTGSNPIANTMRVWRFTVLPPFVKCRQRVPPWAVAVQPFGHACEMDGRSGLLVAFDSRCGFSCGDETIGRPRART